MHDLTAGMCGRIEPRQLEQHFSRALRRTVLGPESPPPPQNSDEEAVGLLHESSPKDTVGGATSLAFRGGDHSL